MDRSEPYSLDKIKQIYRTETFGPDIWKCHINLHNYIFDLKPESIFEFGSAWGKNGYLMMQYIKDLKYAGVDINETHVRQAENMGIDVKLGDESYLSQIPDNSFDVAFTSSVLNHLPYETVLNVVAHLKRIARKHVVVSETVDLHGERFYSHSYTELGFKDTGIKAWTEHLQTHYHIFHMQNTSFS